VLFERPSEVCIDFANVAAAGWRLVRNYRTGLHLFGMGGGTQVTWTGAALNAQIRLNNTRRCKIVRRIMCRTKQSTLYRALLACTSHLLLVTVS